MELRYSTLDYIKVMRTLPPLVAALAWDVLNGNITPQTIELANYASDEEYRDYDLVRSLVNVHPIMAEHARELSQAIIDVMVQERQVTQ